VWLALKYFQAPKKRRIREMEPLRNEVASNKKTPIPFRTGAVSK
jgi:hypothetical protein